MDNFIINLLETSVYSCLMVAVVLLLRFCLKKASRAAICMLWILVGLRLLIVFPIESKYAVIPDISCVFSVSDQTNGYYSLEVKDISCVFSVSDQTADVSEPEADAAGVCSDNIIRSTDSVQNNRQYSAEPAYEGLIEGNIKNSADVIDDRSLTGERKASTGLVSVLGIIWIAGTSLMWIYGIVYNLIIKKQLSTAVKDYSTNDVFYTEHTDSAFVFGIRKPKIYVGFVVEEKDKEYILAHEREHIRRKDHLIKLIGYMLLSLYWFAPWIWAAFLLLCKDMELACDEGVISSMEPVQRADYAGTLFKIGTGRLSTASGMIYFGEVSVKERIKRIMDYKKKAAGITGLLLVILVICIIVLIPIRASKAEDKTENTENVGELTPVSDAVDSFAVENSESEKMFEEKSENAGMPDKDRDIKSGEPAADDDDDYTDEYNYNTDAYNYDSIINACYVACGNELAKEETSEEIILQAGDGVKASKEWKIAGGKDGHENFEKWMNTALGKGWQERFGVCAVNSVGVNGSQEYDTDHCVYTITVKNGKVYRTWAPAWKSDRISRIYP